MSTFLEICQKVARESGTIAGVNPSTVVSQSGRLLKVVNWVIDAWTEIQNERENWLWMRKEFEDTAVTITAANTVRYTPAAWNLTDHSRWVTDDHSVTMYLVATGVSAEGELNFLPWNEFRMKYLRGTQTANKPIEYSISPANEFCVGPKPDDVYCITGEYYSGNETMALDADVPDLPARFHDLIAWRALRKLHFTDEAADGLAYANDMHDPLHHALERDQLPEITIASSATLA